MMQLRYERKKPESDTKKFSPDSLLIWHPSQVETYYDKPINAYCHFRKTFSLEKKPKSAKIALFADTRYVLFVNGSMLAKGPCRSDPRWQYYDEVDITDYVEAGENVIALTVLHYGYGSGQSMHRVPGLFLECRVVYHGGNVFTFGTDESWKTVVSKGYDSDMPRINGCKGPMECIDGRFYPHGFTLRGFDDSAWDTAKGRDVSMSPFWNLRPRPIPMLKEEYALAQYLIAAGEDYEVKGFDKKHLHRQIKKEIEQLTINPLDNYSVACNVNPVEVGKFSYVILDFGKVQTGYLRLVVKGYAGDIIDAVYAEELYEGKPHFDGVSYRPISRFILNDGDNDLTMQFDYEAYRYVMLIFRNHVRTNELKEVGIRTKYYPMEDVSAFSSDNEALNQIWDISVHTLRLCMQDGFLDSPSREQQQWMGDGRYQAIMNYYVSGDARMHKKLLLQMAQSQDYEGMTTSRYPDENFNLPPIASFCLQWVNSFGDLYDFTGETDLICELWEGIIRAMRWFSAFENEKGLLCDVPYWQYYDMGKNEAGESSDFWRGGVNTLLNLMYLEAVETVVRLGGITGDTQTERYFKAKSKRLQKEIKEQLWHEKKHAYADCFAEGKLSESISETVNAMAILTLHDASDKRTGEMVKNVFAKATRRKDIVKASPYFMLPYIRAMKKAKRNDIALDEILERYGEMIKTGATSTWEHWELFSQMNNGVYMHSACHAWAAAPIVFVAESLLGISLTGKKLGKACPDLLGLQKVQAKIVTSKGVFAIESEKKNLVKNEFLAESKDY